MAGPKYSNRTFAVYEGKEIHLTPGFYIIEVWQGRDFQNDMDVDGALDIKVYSKDDAMPYGKGDQKAFFRVFENTGQKKNKTVRKAIHKSKNILKDEQTRKEDFDDDIPF